MMKKTVRLFALLLSVLMIGSLFAVAASADFEPDANNTASWKVDDGKLVGDNTAGANESNLKLFELPAGLTDYTVEAEMTLLTASGSQYGALLSNWKSGTEYVGVWVRANGTVNFEQRATSYTKVPAEAPAAVTEIGVNVTYKLKLHFHGGTADLYIGEGTTPYAAGTLQLGEYSGYVAVMIKPGTKIAFDNFKVTNNTSSAVLWQDDFSSGAGEWGEKTEEKLGLDTFGWTVNPQYNSTGYEFKISGRFGAAGNKSLHIHADTDNWCGMIIAPAEKLTDVKQYVFSVKTAFDSARKLTFRFNSSNEASADGDWGGVSWNTQMENVGYEGNTTKSNATIDNVTYDLEMNEIAIAFDLEAGTEKIYLNGTLLSTRSTDVHSASGAVSMIVRMFDGYVDDLKLEAGTFENRGNLIWKEDFESYELSAGEEAVKERPAQDYTGRTPGQVIFEDDYNAVQNLEDFYFVAKLSGDFGKAEYSIADSIDGTPCARITGNWASVEIVPKEVFTPYQTYTIHMKVKFDSNENRFALFYNTASPLSNSNSGFLDIRYHDPVKIENLGIVGGSVLKDEANTEAKIGEPFDLAVTVKCDGGTNLVYINGEIVSAGASINTTQSALYIVVQSCVAYIDDVKVTAGTYDDYLALNTPQGGDESTSVESDETTTAPTPGTTAPEQTTESAPVSTEAPSETASTETPSGNKGGCGSVIGTGALALIGVLSLGCVFIGKRRETF